MEKLPRILIGSKNPVKANAITLAFQDMFGCNPFTQQVSVDSGVSDQPMSNDETWQGAYNRAASARNLGFSEPGDGFDFYVGIEGGIESVSRQESTVMHAFAWIVILSDSNWGEARSATFPLPPAIAKLVDEGVELGHADDIVFDVKNSKQDAGAVGLLTDGIVDRESLYRHAARLAWIPFKNTSLFNR